MLKHKPLPEEGKGLAPILPWSKAHLNRSQRVIAFCESMTITSGPIWARKRSIARLIAIVGSDFYPVARSTRRSRAFGRSIKTDALSKANSARVDSPLPKGEVDRAERSEAPAGEGVRASPLNAMPLTRIARSRVQSDLSPTETDAAARDDALSTI